MSETSNGMPDLSAGDSEPSMEDILASIRKIIADDKTENHALESETEQLLTPAIDEIEDTTSFTEKVEEQQFEIPEVEGTSQDIDTIIPEPTELTEEPSFEDEEILDLINFAEKETSEEKTAEIETVEETTADIVPEFEPATGEADTAFDESLDLVMDSDASDYYSESVESDENRLLREEIENDLSIETESFEPLASTSLDVDLVSDDNEVSAVPNIEDLLDPEADDSDDILSLDEDDDDDDVFSSFDTPETEDLSLETDFEDLVESVDLAEDSAGAEDDEDMDLVKSLLADLMDDAETEEFDDEPAETFEEESAAAFVEDEDEADNILDEILYQSMEDETAISEAVEGAEDPEESELAQIARNAREAAATPYPNREAANPADTVQLPDRKLGERLNLSAAGGFVGVAAGAAIVGASGNDEPEALDEQVSQMVEEELELAEIEELLDMIEETEAEDVETENVEIDEDFGRRNRAGLKRSFRRLVACRAGKSGNGRKWPGHWRSGTRCTASYAEGMAR